MAASPDYRIPIDQQNTPYTQQQSNPMNGKENMEEVVAVAIGLLAAIFVGSMVAIVVICSNRKCRKGNYLAQAQREARQDAVLVENMDGNIEVNTADVELDDVGINTNMEEILHDSNWVSDATGLVPHCLAILRICHSLTEKLVGMTMGNSQQLRNPESLTDLITIAKRINPRVDDVMRAMYPPLDPRLLEARCTALALSVSHLVLVTKNMCRLSGVLDWIDQSMADVEDHLKVLREASTSFESQPRSALENTPPVPTPHPVPVPPQHGLPGPDVTETAGQQPQQQQAQQPLAANSGESSDI